MPNEEVMTKGDLSRELCFVLHGACHVMQEDRIKRVVRDDVSPPSHDSIQHSLLTKQLLWVIVEVG
jgi:hypothetical protein